ncbi:hypothetical protein ACLOJK_039572 [Asimina triloba]
MEGQEFNGLNHDACNLKPHSRSLALLSPISVILFMSHDVTYQIPSKLAMIAYPSNFQQLSTRIISLASAHPRNPPCSCSCSLPNHLPNQTSEPDSEPGPRQARKPKGSAQLSRWSRARAIRSGRRLDRPSNRKENAAPPPPPSSSTDMRPVLSGARIDDDEDDGAGKPIYMVSDGTGWTAEHSVNAALGQFEHSRSHTLSNSFAR